MFDRVNSHSRHSRIRAPPPMAIVRRLDASFC